MTKKALPPLMDEFRIKINSYDEFAVLINLLSEKFGSQTDEKNNIKWRFRKYSLDGTKLTGARCRVVQPLRNGKALDLGIEVYTKDHDLDNDDLLMIKIKGT